MFQDEIQGKGVCLDFIETVHRETIVRDARRAALAIQASTAKVILIFCWYTDVKELFLELNKMNVSDWHDILQRLKGFAFENRQTWQKLNIMCLSCPHFFIWRVYSYPQVTDRQFVASEAWSTSDDILQDPATSKVASGVLGVAIRSSTIPGFEKYLRNLHPVRRPDDGFLGEFWEKEFGCSTGNRASFSYPSSPLKAQTDHPSNFPTPSLAKESVQKASLPPCSGTESLEAVQHPFTDTSQLRGAYNVYLAVYAAAHALHSLLSCPNGNSPPGKNSSTCSFPKHIKPIQVNTIISVSFDQPTFANS